MADEDPGDQLNVVDDGLGRNGRKSFISRLTQAMPKDDD
jgi:hypothetical protein